MPYPHPCRAGSSRERAKGTAQGPGVGHLSPSLQARRSAGTAQGRAAPWRFNSRVEAIGAGGCVVSLLQDRFLLPALGSGVRGKGRVLKRPPPEDCPVLSLPFRSPSVPFSVFSLFLLPASLPLFLPSPLPVSSLPLLPPLPFSRP